MQCQQLEKGQKYNLNELTQGKDFKLSNEHKQEEPVQGQDLEQGQ